MLENDFLESAQQLKKWEILSNQAEPPLVSDI